MQMCVHIAQSVGFRQQLAMVFHQLFRADAVLACQGIALAQPFFHLGQAFRIQVQPFQVMPQVVGGGLHLQAGRLHGVGDGGQAFILIAGLVQPVADLAQMVVAGAVLALIKRVQGLLASTNQTFRIAKPLLFLFQLLQFAFLQGQTIQLFQLEAQQLLLFVLLAGLIQGVVVGTASFLPGAPVIADGVGQLPGLGEVVEKLPVSVLFHQCLVLVLAVDADQPFAELTHFRQGGGGAIHVGP